MGNRRPAFHATARSLAQGALAGLLSAGPMIVASAVQHRLAPRLLSRASGTGKARKRAEDHFAEDMAIAAGAVPLHAPERKRKNDDPSVMKLFAFGAVSGLVFSAVAGRAAVPPWIKAGAYCGELWLNRSLGRAHAGAIPVGSQLVWGLFAAYLMKKWAESGESYMGEPNLEMA